MGKKGWKWSEESRRKLSKTNTGKNNPFYGHKHSKKTLELLIEYSTGSNNSFYGRHHSEESKTKMGPRGSNHPDWKGEDPGYSAIHTWIRKVLIKPNICSRCNQNKRLELSNISGQYLRDINDWQWLCASCHNQFDEQAGSKVRDSDGRYTKSIISKRIRSFKNKPTVH